MRTVQEPPEAAPHALIRISTDAFTWVQPGSRCESAANPRGGLAVSANSVYVGARSLQGQQRGVAGNAPAGLASGEIRLTAGEPQVVTYTVGWRRGDWQYSCHAARSFVPEAGAHYQMLTVSDEATRRCGIQVMQLQPTPAVVQTAEAPACPKS